MKQRYEIWVTGCAWNNGSSGVGYEWELFCNDKPISKSSPAHGDAYYYQKRSAVASAKRMRSLTNRPMAIYDVTNRTKKIAI